MFVIMRKYLFRSGSIPRPLGRFKNLVPIEVKMTSKKGMGSKFDKTLDFSLTVCYNASIVHRLEEKRRANISTRLTMVIERCLYTNI
jgi:hypothetical protein